MNKAAVFAIGAFLGGGLTFAGVSVFHATTPSPGYIEQAAPDDTTEGQITTIPGLTITPLKIARSGDGATLTLAFENTSSEKWAYIETHCKMRRADGRLYALGWANTLNLDPGDGTSEEINFDKTERGARWSCTATAHR